MFCVYNSTGTRAGRAVGGDVERAGSKSEASSSIAAARHTQNGVSDSRERLREEILLRSSLLNGILMVLLASYLMETKDAMQNALDDFMKTMEINKGV
uniref:Uncharacterized protein n=1 Tax=Anopheles albimanus TaxID=7167 RepID=A0A182F5P3_ANOAL